MERSGTVARPRTGKTPVRNLRVGAVWDLALRIARRREETITSVITRALEAYVAENRIPGDDEPEPDA